MRVSAWGCVKKSGKKMKIRHADDRLFSCQSLPHA
jgi:hypothetical protein